MVLDNSSRLKDSESFNKVIQSLDLSKEDREDCKKLVADKLKEVNEKGGSKNWVVRIRGQPGPSMPLLTEEEQLNELTELDFFCSLSYFFFILIYDESCMHSLSYLVKLYSLL